MKPYLNREAKELMCVLAHMEGFIAECLRRDMPLLRPYRRRYKTICTYIVNTVEEMKKEFDTDHLRIAQRQMDHSRLIVVPKEDIRLKKDSLLILPRDTVMRLVNAAFSECFLCEKDKKGVKACQMRLDLLDCGAIPTDNGKGECPFKSGML